MEYDIELIKSSLKKMRIILILNAMITLGCVVSIVLLWQTKNTPQQKEERMSQEKSEKDSFLENADKTEIEEEKKVEKTEKKTKDSDEKYMTKIQETTYAILDNCALIEDNANLMVRVWNNAIMHQKSDLTDPYTRRHDEVPDLYKDFPELYDDFYDDFNDALDNLFNDEDYSNKNAEIESNDQEIKAMIKQLNNPPVVYKALYQDFKEYYDSYVEFLKILTPQGSYNEFSQQFLDCDDQCMQCYEKVIRHFE